VAGPMPISEECNGFVVRPAAAPRQSVARAEGPQGDAMLGLRDARAETDSAAAAPRNFVHGGEPAAANLRPSTVRCLARSDGRLT
jgi:hypothetical protein